MTGKLRNLASSAPKRRQLVLVGGGHTHVQVLRRFAMAPPENTHVIVVLDVPVAVYSGMVPGFVAGQYRKDELEIDVVPLARRARAAVLLHRAVGVDAERRRILLEGRPPLPYDLASFDVGSIVAALDLPGVRQHALPTRPIGLLVERVHEVIDAARAGSGDQPFRLCVVGGGAGGVEMAFTLRERVKRETGRAVKACLVHEGERLLLPEAAAARVERAAARRGITVRHRVRIREARAGSVLTEAGEEIPCDALIWVTGAVSHPLFRDSGLQTDARGFVLTRSTLQVVGYDDLFAVGDCATLEEYPETPKSGVYAVRQGPYLIDNLLAALAGRPPRHYRPQHDFLMLLNKGDGSAIGSKWGRAFEGPWVMRLKDRIDCRFMRRFQVLAPAGGLTEVFRTQPAMGGDGDMPMLCGGCAAKVGQSVLARALERLAAERPRPQDPATVLGLERPDDAAAYRTPSGDVVVLSVDLFRAFTDDPWLVGRVAAINALSDVQAKGVEPRHALALVSVPDDLDRDAAEEVLYQVLAGARAAFDPLGVVMLGGHSTTAPILQVGFSVEGIAADPEALLALDRLRPGDALILTQPLGTGVVLHADMQGLARGPWLQATIAAMLRNNGAAARLALGAGASAVTDVTGFGLAGHLGEMAHRSGVTATIDLGQVPALPGALELLRLGLRSTFHSENARAAKGMDIPQELRGDLRLELLFDPQTSGGLLIGIGAGRAAELTSQLRSAGYSEACQVGRAEAPAGHGLQVRSGLSGTLAIGTRLPGPD